MRPRNKRVKPWSIEWDKFVNTHLSHSRPWFNINVSHVNTETHISQKPFVYQFQAILVCYTRTCSYHASLLTVSSVQLPLSTHHFPIEIIHCVICIANILKFLFFTQQQISSLPFQAMHYVDIHIIVVGDGAGRGARAPLKFGKNIFRAIIV